MECYNLRWELRASDGDCLKRIIFFDGDGTLWYPKKTKYSKPPWSVYNDARTRRNPLKHQMLMPNVLKTLRYLKARGIKMAIISTQPDRCKKDRRERLLKKLRYFGILEFFDYIEPSKVVSKRDKPDSKGKQMISVLRRARLPKSSALMVGDLYGHDYLPARKAGIDAVLIDGFTYPRESAGFSRVRRKIHDISGIKRYI